MAAEKPGSGKSRVDRMIAEANRARAARETDYRGQALKMYPWICGRCGREFTHANAQLLEVHHRDHNHDNNPPDGSNWELLCTYCHENEHRRYLDHAGTGDPQSGASQPRATFKAFEDLDALLKGKDKR
ncbi:MAG: HNH nuclease family protein [Betaproteobacteria bacterium]|nr:HNH nuclease family protein [Betaproteobacteria bacterium]